MASAPYRLENVVPWGRNLDEYIRVFPLLDLDANRSVHLTPLMNALKNLGHTPRLETVSYEVIKGANQMLIFLIFGHITLPKLIENQSILSYNSF